MLQTQEIIDIEKMDILNKAREMHQAGYRLVQMCALKDLTMLYGFEKDHKLVTLRFNAAPPDPVESISSVYSYAFMYENEIKDLFGIDIANINLDFKGHFYETAIKMPFRAVNKEGASARPGGSVAGVSPVERRGLGQRPT